MDTNTSAGLLQIISAAVTPVVMISACAALILGVNGKHLSIADRVRAASAEYRASDTTENRKSQLLEQIQVFQRRFRLTWFALSALFGAVILFTCSALLIVLSHRKLATGSVLVVELFLGGVVLMLISAVVELYENGLSTRSLRVEVEDILTNSARSPIMPGQTEPRRKA